MSIATHMYSEKTSHHGFRTRYLVFCSVPKFLNSPTGIILAAAPHWWKRGRTETKIGFSTLPSPENLLTQVLKLYDTQKERKCTETLGFPLTVASDTCALQWLIGALFTVGGSKVEKLVWQHVTSTERVSFSKCLRHSSFRESESIGAVPYAKWPFSLFDGNNCNHH